jgi:hypothetical protein
MRADGWTYRADDLRASWESLVDAMAWWPNSKLEVASPFPGHYELRVVLVAPDSYHPETTGRVGHRKPLPEHIHRAGPDAMEAYLRRCLREVAVHEADEWLVIAGRRPFNPHHIRGAVHV